MNHPTDGRGSSRRQFLAGLGALSAGVLASRGMTATFAQGTSGARRIDVHHHFASPAWKTALAGDGALNNVWKQWTPARSLETMDKSGTQTAVLSVTTPGVWFGEGFGNGLQSKGSSSNAEATKLARETNEYAAKLVSDYKGRFGLFAQLALPDIDGSLKEAAYAFDTLKADGIGLITSYGNRWVGDPMFSPVFEELNRRRAVIYVHPTAAPCCRDLIPKVGPTVIEYNTDTTRTIVSWIESGSATRFPNITWIFSHAGGTMPYLIERFIGRGPAQNLDKAEPNSKLYHLKRFYYDTAQSVNVIQLQALKTLVSASHICFGTDYPYTTMVDHVDGIKNTKVFSETELRQIDRENVVKLLPRFA